MKLNPLTAPAHDLGVNFALSRAKYDCTGSAITTTQSTLASCNDYCRNNAYNGFSYERSGTSLCKCCDTSMMNNLAISNDHDVYAISSKVVLTPMHSGGQVHRLSTGS